MTLGLAIGSDMETVKSLTNVLLFEFTSQVSLDEGGLATEEAHQHRISCETDVRSSAPSRNRYDTLQIPVQTYLTGTTITAQDELECGNVLFLSL